jgi:rhodanese-related sulfurtransferase
VTGLHPHTIDNVSVDETWARLKADKASVLIDVRTAAEWSFVGVPDLKDVGKKLIQIEWQSYPDGELNARFADILQEALGRVGHTQESDLFFICRSGARSMMAAQSAARVGFVNCHNVADGFEGHLDADRKRGRTSGWKARGLPWVQG